MSVLSSESREILNAPDTTGVPAAKAALRRRRILVNSIRVLILVVFLVGWQFLTTVGIIDPFFWGQPSGIWNQLVTWVTQGTAQGPLWQQIFATLVEAILGFFIGGFFGVIFGIVLGRNRFLADVLGIYIKALNSIPRIVLGPIFVIGLGLGLQSKVALAAVLVFFIVFFNAFQGVREVDRNVVANARILGASERQLSNSVIIPSAMSWIFASLHTSFSFALVGAVVGEYLGSTEGLGLMIQNAGNTFNVNGVFAGMLILAVVALASEAVITALENRLIKWRPNTVSDVTI
jgi:NitT/TauT family transport system permease protein